MSSHRALAFNLRPVSVSVSPVLAEVRASLSMSATTAAVVTTLPVLCFAFFGLLAPGAARAIGIHKVMLGSLVLAGLAVFVRAEAPNTIIFLGATVPALAGMATANVLLPSLVKQHFPHRIGLLTGIYSTALAVGLSLSSVLTVPIAEVAGSWRFGLAAWAVTAVLAALPWLALIRHDVRPDTDGRATLSVHSSAASRLPGGLGTGMFPLALTLIGLRARTIDGTAALSGFTQSVDYLIAAIGPFTMGALYDVTGGWALSLSVLAAFLVPQAVAGLLVSRPRYVADELVDQPSSTRR